MRVRLVLTITRTFSCASRNIFVKDLNKSLAEVVKIIQRETFVRIFWLVGSFSILVNYMLANRVEVSQGTEASVQKVYLVNFFARVSISRAYLVSISRGRSFSFLSV